MPPTHAPRDGAANDWQPPPTRPTLNEQPVHVYRARLDLPAPEVRAMGRLLSPDERLRADRYHFQRDRNWFIVRRGLLRTIVSRYVGRPAQHLRFGYQPAGKPTLAEPAGPGLRFNVSHSEGLALFALAQKREVGVDLERLRPELADVAIAQRFFSPTERAALIALPPEQRLTGFFNCWTRKEAYVKARGLGLALPLDQFDVSLAPGQPARILRADDDPDVGRHWSMWTLTPAEDYVAAVAVQGIDCQLECFG